MIDCVFYQYMYKQFIFQFLILKIKKLGLKGL